MRGWYNLGGMKHYIELKGLRLLALTALAIGIIGCSSDKADKAETPDKTESADKTETETPTEPPKEEPGDEAEQSFAQAIALICEVPTKIPEIEKIDPAERPKLMADWIKERVTNEKAKQLFQQIADAEPSEKTSLLKAAAEEVGLTSCSMAQAVMPVTKGTVQTITTDTPTAE